MKTTVIAIGGNSLWRKGQSGTADEQRHNARKTARSLLPLIGKRKLVITHGNGPQVGAILLQNESCTEVPSMPLDVCGAQTQGQIGYVLQQEINNILRENKFDIRCASIITQVLVSSKDPAFSAPSKPVGPFITKEEANWASEEKGWAVKEIKGGYGWRRLVPSPKPVRIMEVDLIRKVLDSSEDTIIIAAGGGGIPVVETPNGFQGIEAVIDKDIASLELAKQLNADEFILLTDEEYVYLDYSKPEQRPLNHTTVDELLEYVKEGQFPAGSMGPKVNAAVDFIRSGGQKVIITKASSLARAMDGETGTTCTG